MVWKTYIRRGAQLVHGGRGWVEVVATVPTCEVTVNWPNLIKRPAIVEE